MKNLFISYDIAVKLKEKGFNESCLAFYSTSANAGDYNFNQFWFAPIAERDYEKNDTIQNSFFTNKNSCTAPLYQQVTDWFRNKYNICICVDKQSYKLLKYRISCILKINGFDLIETQEYNYDSNDYHKALTDAIIKALTLI